MRREDRAGSPWAAALLSLGLGALGPFGAAAALGAQAAFGETGSCTGLRWNVAREHALFQGAGERTVAGRDSRSAPIVRPDRLYDLALAPQQEVRFVLHPEKRSITDGAYAGLARLHVAAGGLYRISIDKPFWVDVIANGQMVESRDFAGLPGCGPPRKIVVYELPSGNLVLQLSGAISTRVRVTLTRVPPGTPTPPPSAAP